MEDPSSSTKTSGSSPEPPNFCQRCYNTGQPVINAPGIVPCGLCVDKGGLRSEVTDASEVLKLAEAVKHDAGKPRVDLVPPDALLELGRVYGYGAGKVGEHNWLRGTRWSRWYAAALRHLLAFWRGHDRNPDDGDLLHVAQAAFNVLALLTYQLRGLGEDDRQKEDGHGA